MQSLKNIMPILKVNILGFQVEINYEEKEHKKLLNLIDNFKERLNEFPIDGKHSNYKLMFLAALKAEDEIFDKSNELSNIIKKNIRNENQINENEKMIKKLNEEVISLKDDIYQINSNNSLYKDQNSLAFNEINKI
jgi:cell division protein ZapA (FtsZ GTPase activity inhibitor)